MSILFLLLSKLGAPRSCVPSFHLFFLPCFDLIASFIKPMGSSTAHRESYFISYMFTTTHFSFIVPLTKLSPICSSNRLPWCFAEEHSSQPTNRPLRPPTFFYLCLTHQIHLSPPWNLILLPFSYFIHFLSTSPRRTVGFHFILILKITPPNDFHAANDYRASHVRL